jgi:hypothetical protein
MVLFASHFSNMIYHRLGLQMSSTPLLYPDTVYFLSRTRTFNISKARKLLGYYPIVSLEVSLLPNVLVLTIICIVLFLNYVFSASELLPVCNETVFSLTKQMCTSSGFDV